MNYQSASCVHDGRVWVDCNRIVAFLAQVRKELGDPQGLIGDIQKVFEGTLEYYEQEGFEN